MTDLTIGATNILDLLSQKIVGQQVAISRIASTVKTYQAGLAPTGVLPAYSCFLDQQAQARRER